MTSKKQKQLVLKWKDWIDIIISEVADLLVSQDIFDEIRRLANNNELIRSPYLYLNWLTKNYVARIVIVIRRLLDKDSRSISLYRLIADIQSNPEAIIRADFISRYPEFMRDIPAVRDYERFAEKGSSSLSPDKAKADLAELIAVGETIKNFVDKYIAHHDSDQDKHLAPTLEDIGEVLAFVDKLVCKYNILVNGGGMSTVKPVLQFDWKEPLRHTWLALTDEETQWRKEYRKETGEEYKPD